MKKIVHISAPSEKQKLFLKANTKHIAFGGARGGGKSWAVRTKAKLLALRYAGIRILIVRRSYPELTNNHISVLRSELAGIARYSDKDKVLTFDNGSTIAFSYCAKDGDLDRLQGVEYDVIFLDEATQLSEYQMRTIIACVRGVNDFPKRIYYTCNPGGQGHGYIKRLFIDRQFQPGEDPSEYTFIQSLVSDNKALMQAQPDYIRQLENLPPKLKKAWLHGGWDIFEGQFFEDFRTVPDTEKCRKLGLRPEEAARQGRFTHVIPPFDLNAGDKRGWVIYRSYDFGYAKPFSCGWWAIDHDGTMYRILELYGCTGEPDQGVKWTPDRQFAEIARIEREHPWLKGRQILGVADPAIWDASRGESVADTALRYGIFFTPGDHKRIPGWMQCHYRLQFDQDGYARCYVFDTCKAFIRTVQTLQFDPVRPEDLDTTGEDHIADEWRYLCMARPVKPIRQPVGSVQMFDPLGQMDPQYTMPNT